MQQDALGAIAHFTVNVEYITHLGRYRARFAWSTPEQSLTFDRASLRADHEQTDLFNEVSQRVALWIDDVARETSWLDERAF